MSELKDLMAKPVELELSNNFKIMTYPPRPDYIGTGRLGPGISKNIFIHQIILFLLQLRYFMSLVIKKDLRKTKTNFKCRKSKSELWIS